MERTLYQCTADDLATKGVDAVPIDWSTGEAHEWLAENRYDVAPVVDGGQPSGFVDMDDVAEVPEDASVAEHAREITLEEIISTDAPFGDVLSALYDQGYYFLGGRNEVTGILTRADLNKSPASIHLYDRLSVLEEALREVIQEEAPDWKQAETIDLYRDEVQEIKRRYQQAQSANISLAEIHYAQFSTVAKIIAGAESCWQTCGFESGDAADRALRDITDVRNAIAHSNLLVENTDEGLMEGRTVGSVLDAYEEIQGVLEAVES